jgi:hypothetical protein
MSETSGVAKLLGVCCFSQCVIFCLVRFERISIWRNLFRVGQEALKIAWTLNKTRVIPFLTLNRNNELRRNVCLFVQPVVNE